MEMSRDVFRPLTPFGTYGLVTEAGVEQVSDSCLHRGIPGLLSTRFLRNREPSVRTATTGVSAFRAIGHIVGVVVSAFRALDHIVGVVVSAFRAIGHIVGVVVSTFRAIGHVVGVAISAFRAIDNAGGVVVVNVVRSINTLPESLKYEINDNLAYYSFVFF